MSFSIEKSYTSLTEEMKSKFLAYAIPLKNPEEFKPILMDIKKQHKKPILMLESITRDRFNTFGHYEILNNNLVDTVVVQNINSLFYNSISLKSVYFSPFDPINYIFISVIINIIR